jgi:hypothetical protein
VIGRKKEKERKCIRTFRGKESAADWYVVTTHIPAAAGAAAGAVRMVEEGKTKRM